MVGLLTLLNIALLVTIWQKTGPRQGPSGPDGGPAPRIIRELGLTSDQQSQFERLKEAHHQSMVELREKGHELRDEFFELLKTDQPDSTIVHEKARAIARNQQEIEMVTFDHFSEVRKLCDANQKKKFDAMIKDVLHSMAAPPGRR